MAANIEIESSEANFNLSATSGFARTTIRATSSCGAYGGICAIRCQWPYGQRFKLLGVVSHQTAETFAAADRPGDSMCSVGMGKGKEKVALTLMVSFGMIMIHDFAQSSS
jgi:hypothetical protein